MVLSLGIQNVVMKTAHIVHTMQKANENAHKAFQQGDYQGAIDCYHKALHLCSSLPTVIEFDKDSFEAMVYADLSVTFGRQSNHMESFAAANKALTFFDKVVKPLNPVETGKYLMAQVNQGTALAVLGCLPAALEALYKAKELFNNKGLDPAKNKTWLDLVEGNIEAIKGQIEKR